MKRIFQNPDSSDRFSLKTAGQLISFVVYGGLLPWVSAQTAINGTATHKVSSPSVSALSDSSAGLQDVPHWLWSKTSADAPAASLRIRKTFMLPSGFAGGTLKLAADFCSARVVVNGRAMAVCAPFSPAVSLEIGTALHVGDNEIRIEAQAIPGPAGLAASVIIPEKSGQTLHLVTDGAWELLDGVSQTLQDRGAVRDELWGRNQASIELSPIDNYEQWRQASRPPAALPSLEGQDKSLQAGKHHAAQFRVASGFQVQLLRTALADEGSWVSLAFDPAGRLTIAKEDQGLLRMTLNPQRSDICLVEVLNSELQECRGLLYAHDSLYANANNSRAMFRLQDTNQDGTLDQVTKLREFSGGVGHGRNDLALGPDGWIYSIHGDSVDAPDSTVADLTSPLRDSRRGARQQEGTLIRTSPDGSQWELVCTGLRNPYGIDFNSAGDVFTWDADNEYDMAAPWYRPTRIFQLFSGADFGWRVTQGNWPPYFPDEADYGSAILDIGKGSPTSVLFGKGLKAPEKYRKAMYVLDWAYGRVLAVHMAPRGGTYRCEPELFLQGRPLNVTDIACGPDGDLYLITGGRKTQSALYRVTWTGKTPDADHALHEQTELHERENEQYAAMVRLVRDEMEGFLKKPPHPDESVRRLQLAFQQLESSDPVVRTQAAVLLEQLPAEQWVEQTLALPTEAAFEAGAMSLMKLKSSSIADRGVQRLLAEHAAAAAVARTGDSGGSDAVAAMRSLAIRLQIFTQLAEEFPETFSAERERIIRDLLTRESAISGVVIQSVPCEESRALRRRVAVVLGEWQAQASVAMGLELLQSQDQLDQLAGLLALRRLQGVLNEQQRRLYFTVLNQGKEFTGGDGMPVFLTRIRDDALAGVSAADQQALGAILQEMPADDVLPASGRSLIKAWTLEDLEPVISADAALGDAERGAAVFRDALCVRCHRVGARGPAVGPDLTYVSRRFSRRDMCESVLSPSKVVAEPWRMTQVTTVSGQIFVGRLISGGDFRSELIRLSTDPLRMSAVQEIDKKQIEDVRTLELSPMPQGLLNTFTLEEIRDLLAWLER